MLDRIAACQKQLLHHKDRLDAIARRKAEILGNLSKIVDENHPCRQELVSIFNRKFKRTKKRTAEDEDEESEEEEMDEDENYDEDDTQQEVCPSACEQSLYEEARTPARM